jgi:uncharacterized protein (DUF927 family)
MEGPKDLADHIKRATGEHYGHAGPAFIEMIARDLDGTRANVRGLVETWTVQNCPGGADGQVKRACDRFALVAAAGELAIAHGLLPWTVGAAAQAAALMLRCWISSRGGVGASEVATGIAQVSRFIEAHGQSRFEETGPEILVPRNVANRAGYRRGVGAQEEWWVLPETWKAEVCAGLDPTHTARALAERGMLVRGTDGFASVRKIAGRPTRVYVLTASVLADGAVGEPLSVPAEA